MKTLERYVFGSFFTSFFLAFLVLSFVLTIGLMVQIAGYILDGVPIGLVGRFAMVSFPETMQWTIPLGLLVASVLVFSRMSADSEVAAMRSCGVNIMSVIKWPLFFAAACTILGIVINNEIVPRGHEIRRRLAKRITVGTGLDILQPGRILDEFPKAKVYFDRKEGNRLYGLWIKDLSDPKVKRTYSADVATVTASGRDIILDLENPSVEPIDADNAGKGQARHLPLELKDVLKDSKYKVREKDMRFWDIAVAIFRAEREVEETADEEKSARAAFGKDDPRTQTARKMKKAARRRASELKTEFMRRLVFAFASISFVLVGVPLGIKAQRKESSVGIAVSLAVALGYYLVTIGMVALDKNYDLHPWYFIWLPVAICFLLAARLIPKNL